MRDRAGGRRPTRQVRDGEREILPSDGRQGNSDAGRLRQMAGCVEKSCAMEDS